MTRPASTVMILRPSGETGFDVLMVRRAAKAVFAGDMYVFPGGAVDACDRGPMAAKAVVGAPDRGQHPWMAAALRETAEEAGVVIADGPVTDRHVHAIASTRDDDLYRAVLAAGVHLDASVLGYVSNWVTPRGEVRRFDTRFYVAVLPESTRARADEVEVHDAIWVSPGQALRRLARGEWQMIFPTIKHLEWLGWFDRPGEVMEFVGGLDAVPVVAPDAWRDEDGTIHVAIPDGTWFDAR